MVDISDILKSKLSQKVSLLSNYKLTNKKFPVGFINIDISFIDNVLIDSLKILPANFVVLGSFNSLEKIKNLSFVDNVSSELIMGFDFFVSQDSSEFTDFMKNGVVPIVSEHSDISGILKEFNASVVQGNSFLFENDSLFDIYYAIIRYLENYKFPYDNKALVKNVLNI